jgi:hypothetical protein
MRSEFVCEHCGEYFGHAPGCPVVFWRTAFVGLVILFSAWIGYLLWGAL